MSLLNSVKRVQFGDDWVDIRPLSANALRMLRVKGAAAVPMEGESKDEAEGFAIQQGALEQCIVAWSDKDPVTPENVANLPLDVALTLQVEMGLGERETPLPTGSPSTDSSEESPAG